METPTITTLAYGSATSTYTPDMFMNLGAAEGFGGVGNAARRVQQPLHGQIIRPDNGFWENLNADFNNPMEAKMARRLVRVIIADPSENVALDKAILYRGDEVFTDLTDQELFFEVDIKSLLEKHNMYRTGLVNKAIRDRTENLEPARIRDLKMTVVTIASF